MDFEICDLSSAPNMSPQEWTQLWMLCSDHASFENSAMDERISADQLATILRGRKSPLNCIIVRNTDGLLGYATFVLQHSTWHPTPYLYLDCLYLHPSARERGIGSVLMKRIQTRAIELGCEEIQWQTPSENHLAVKFYDSLSGSVRRSKFRYFWPTHTNCIFPKESSNMSTVSRVPAADSEQAVDYFSKRLSFETDCWDVHHAITNAKKDFVLLDVRSEEYFAKGHVPSAINFPHWKMNEESLSQFPMDTLFVVYCAGPHCNGANKAALILAKHGRPVKEMIGGAIGWTDEGFHLTTKVENEIAS